MSPCKETEQVHDWEAAYHALNRALGEVVGDLTEARAECAEWRARAEAAERRVAELEEALKGARKLISDAHDLGLDVGENLAAKVAALTKEPPHE